MSKIYTNYTENSEANVMIEYVAESQLSSEEKNEKGSLPLICGSEPFYTFCRRVGSGSL